jgi:hypothetical protein
MSEKTIKVMGYFDKEVEKTKDEFVKLWVSNADLFRLEVCDGTENYIKTHEKVTYLREEIKKLAEFNWECSYKEQEAKKLKEGV